MRWLTVLVLLISLQGQARLPVDSVSRVHFTALNCPGAHNPADRPRVGVVNLGEGREETQVRYSIRPTSLGFEGEVLLSPGFYNAGLVLGKECQSSLLLPVLNNRDQDVLFVGSNGITLMNATMMIAGTAPFAGYTASIVYWPQEQGGLGPKTLVVHPARVQGDSYYAVGLSPGTVRLRISTPDGSNRLEFQIGKIGNGGQRYVTFNVSERDVRNALEHPLSP
jgi:hypothetical protein